MLKWLFAALLVLEAHFAASYLVPLDREAQATFGGLLRWAWAIGDGGILGRILASGEYPIYGSGSLEAQLCCLSSRRWR